MISPLHDMKNLQKSNPEQPDKGPPDSCKELICFYLTLSACKDLSFQAKIL